MVGQSGTRQLGRERNRGEPGMKLLRRLYSKRDFGDPSAAMLADLLFLAVVVAGVLLLLAGI